MLLKQLLLIGFLVSSLGRIVKVRILQFKSVPEHISLESRVIVVTERIIIETSSHISHRHAVPIVVTAVGI